MELRISLLLLFIVFGFKVKSQDKYVDSLIDRSNIENPYDSRVNSYKLLIQHYQYRNRALAFEYIDSLFKIAQLEDDSFRIGIAWCYSADTHLLNGNYEHARKCALKTDSIGKTTDNEILLFGSNNSLGIIESDQGNYQYAIKYYNQGLQVAKKRNDSLKIAVLLSNIGGSYLNLGNYKEAISNLFESLEFLENDKSEERKGINITTISGAFLGINDYEKAIYYGTQAVEKFRKTGHLHTMPAALNNIGEALNAQGNYSEAINKFREGIGIAISTDYQYSLAYCYHGLGNSFLELGNLDSAQIYYSKALDIEEEYDLKLEQSSSLASLGEIHLRNYKYEKAKNYFKRAKILAIETQTIDELTGIMQLMIQTELAVIGDKGLEDNFLNFLKTRDSLYDSDLLLAINEVEAKYQTEKKEQQIKILAQENELQQSVIKRRNSYLIGSAIGGLGLILTLISLFQKRKKEKELFKNSVKRLKVDNAKLITKNLNLKKPVVTTSNEGNDIFRSIDEDIEFAISDIVYISSDKNYIEIHLKENSKPILFRYTLQDYFEDFLSGSQFSRIHRGFVVNIHFISRLTASKVYIAHVENMVALNIGRTYKDAIRKKYNSLAKEASPSRR